MSEQVCLQLDSNPGRGGRGGLVDCVYARGEEQQTDLVAERYLVRLPVCLRVIQVGCGINCLLTAQSVVLEVSKSEGLPKK